MLGDLQSGDAAEFNQLYDALPVAIKRARQILQHSTSSSAAYVAADSEVSRILARINVLANGCLRIPDEIVTSTASLADKPPENAWGR
jgi:hypothetical protein